MKKNKAKYIIIGFLIILNAFIIIVILPLLKNHEWVYMCLSIFIFILVNILANLFSKPNSHNITYKEPPKDIKNTLVNTYQFCDLNQFDELLKVYYSKDREKRIIIHKQNKHIRVTVQSLLIYCDKSIKTQIWIGKWTSMTINSYYMDIDIAIRELDDELKKGYEEINLSKIPPVDLNKNNEYFAEIDWVRPKDCRRKGIPYGNRYIPLIKISGNDNSEHFHSIMVRNIEVLGKYKTRAIVKYTYDNSPNNLYENLCFEIYEGSRKVGIGVIISKRNFAGD